jgi:hypothetical protein
MSGLPYGKRDLQKRPTVQQHLHQPSREVGVHSSLCQEWPTIWQKRPITRQKSPTIWQKRPSIWQKRPTIWQKRPTSVHSGLIACVKSGLPYGKRDLLHGKRDLQLYWHTCTSRNNRQHISVGLFCGVIGLFCRVIGLFFAYICRSLIIPAPAATIDSTTGARKRR